MCLFNSLLKLVSFKSLGVVITSYIWSLILIAGFLWTLPVFKTSEKNPSTFLAVFWLIIFSDTSSNLSTVFKSTLSSNDLGFIVVASSIFSAFNFLLLFKTLTGSSVFLILLVLRPAFFPLAKKVNNKSKGTPIIAPSNNIFFLASSSESASLADKYSVKGFASVGKLSTKLDILVSYGEKANCSATAPTPEPKATLWANFPAKVLAGFILVTTFTPFATLLTPKNGIAKPVTSLKKDPPKYSGSFILSNFTFSRGLDSKYLLPIKFIKSTVAWPVSTTAAPTVLFKTCSLKFSQL